MNSDNSQPIKIALFILALILAIWFGAKVLDYLQIIAAKACLI